MGFEAQFENFQYHPKCQDFSDKSSDIEISSEKSRQIIFNCYSFLNIDKLKQKWVGFEAYYEYFYYHPKCQDFTDNSGDIEISSEKSREIISNCYFHLNIDKLKQNWVGFDAQFEYFQFHTKCQNFSDKSSDIEISSEKSRQIIFNCYFHLNDDKLKQEWVGFEAYYEYFKYHPKCQDFTDNSDDIEISSEKSRQIILKCYFHLNIDTRKQK